MEDLSLLIEDLRNRSSDFDELELLKYRSENAIGFLMDLVHDTSDPLFDEILTNVTIMHQILCREIRHTNSKQLAVLQISGATANRGVGRPRCHIQKETLINLKNIGFTWVQLANMLLVSWCTIQRRVEEFQIEEITGFLKVSDAELDQYVRTTKEKFGAFAGRSMITEFLNSKGLQIQRSRIMKSLVRVDPSGN